MKKLSPKSLSQQHRIPNRKLSFLRLTFTENPPSYLLQVARPGRAANFQTNRALTSSSSNSISAAHSEQLGCCYAANLLVLPPATKQLKAPPLPQPGLCLVPQDPITSCPEIEFGRSMVRKIIFLIKLILPTTKKPFLMIFPLL